MSSIVSTVIAAVILGLLVKGRWLTRYYAVPRIKSKISKLLKNTTDEEVLNFIEFVNKAPIKSDNYTNSALKVSYKIVSVKSTVSREFKEKLRHTLISKGCNL